MILLLHIVIALASVGYATYTFVAPSKAKVQVSNGLIASTLISGTYLAINNPAHILQACLTGLGYTLVVSLLSYAAYRKLSYAKVRNK